MSKIENEVKIAEKLKFWEEQDHINKELIPRVISNYDKISDLTYQLEKNLDFLANLQVKIDKSNENVSNEIRILKKENSILQNRIEELQKELILYKQVFRSINENKIAVSNSQDNGERKSTENLRTIPKTRQKKDESKGLIRENTFMKIGITSSIVISIIALVV
ncbi:hypothetical protein [Guptibacillus sedimenti]|uniref:hypothetical protein n=1 Tax=Guptibacillus sedimenti TaxID=3025680 RepID=UPI002363031A|nr:hypothetical protein [Pseudalkalibacillus sedimenti]